MKNHTLSLILALIYVFSQAGCITLGAETESVSSPTERPAMTESDVPIQNRNLEMSLTVMDSGIVLNQPILLKFSVKNNGGETTKLDLGQNFKAAFDFSIVLPDGTRTRLPRIRRDGFSAKGLVEVKVDQVYAQDILLNEWITPNQVGTYTLTGAINSGIDTSGASGHGVPQFGVTFTIEPENSDRLKQISQKLLKRISESNNYAEAAHSALALTHVRNPVVIPYLKEALTANRMVDSVIVKSLREIGSTEAVEVLISIVETMPDSELALQAVNALKGIELKSSDPTQRTRIRQYLKY